MTDAVSHRPGAKAQQHSGNYTERMKYPDFNAARPPYIGVTLCKMQGFEQKLMILCKSILGNINQMYILYMYIIMTMQRHKRQMLPQL